MPHALGATQAARINAWVAIGTDNTVTILRPSAEMGQGVMTSLPLILAEELARREAPGVPEAQI